ncbi:hypothetical protein ANCCAN_27674, partial [Ancylostoma caninum]
DEVPFPDVFGYFAAPGTATSMGVRFVQTSRLPHPYGTCTKEELLAGRHYNGTYLVENEFPLGCCRDIITEFVKVESCFRNCLQEKIVADCGCYDPAYPFINDGTIKSCDDVGDSLLNCKSVVIAG